jgi:hypothetical protein
VKTSVKYTATMPAMPKMGGAGNGYAPADDYSLGAGVFYKVES